VTRQALLERIKRKAKRDAKNRKDPRFLETMGFLVAKGFLKTNFEIVPLPNKRLRIDDAVWAGKNVEPRILEVLPAAVLRLEKHFDGLDANRELAKTVAQLRGRQEEGDSFCDVPYRKLKVWTELPLLDKRVKTVAEKKRIKTFRLDPDALERLKTVARERDSTETEVLEKLLLGLR
jgi:hypothetical protein